MFTGDTAGANVTASVTESMNASGLEVRVLLISSLILMISYCEFLPGSRLRINLKF